MYIINPARSSARNIKRKEFFPDTISGRPGKKLGSLPFSQEKKEDGAYTFQIRHIIIVKVSIQ